MANKGTSHFRMNEKLFYIWTRSVLHDNLLEIFGKSDRNDA